jgi:hypothetical protein
MTLTDQIIEWRDRAVEAEQQRDDLKGRLVSGEAIMRELVRLLDAIGGYVQGYDAAMYQGITHDARSFLAAAEESTP